MALEPPPATPLCASAAELCAAVENISGSVYEDLAHHQACGAPGLLQQLHILSVSWVKHGQQPEQTSRHVTTTMNMLTLYTKALCGFSTQQKLPLQVRLALISIGSRSATSDDIHSCFGVRLGNASVNLPSVVVVDVSLKLHPLRHLLARATNRIAALDTLRECIEKVTLRGSFSYLLGTDDSDIDILLRRRPTVGDSPSLYACPGILQHALRARNVKTLTYGSNAFKLYLTGRGPTVVDCTVAYENPDLCNQVRGWANSYPGLVYLRTAIQTMLRRVNRPSPMFPLLRLMVAYFRERENATTTEGDVVDFANVLLRRIWSACVCTDLDEFGYPRFIAGPNEPCGLCQGRPETVYSLLGNANDTQKGSQNQWPQRNRFIGHCHELQRTLQSIIKANYARVATVDGHWVRPIIICACYCKC